MCGKIKGETPMQRCTLLALPLSIGFLAIALPAAAANVDASNCTTATMWQEAYNKGDTDAVAAMYAPDAIEVMETGIRVGPTAVKERLEDNLKRGVKFPAITSTKCDIDGDIRISAGDWKGESPQGSFGGFWTAIERKDGGKWKMINLTANTTPPPASK
jgi:ketosteroid isomerase-like protein